MWKSTKICLHALWENQSEIWENPFINAETINNNKKTPYILWN